MENAQWYYAADGQQKGPLGKDDLAALIRTSAVSRETLVWNPSLTAWTPASQTELAQLFFNPVPPRIPTGSTSLRPPLVQTVSVSSGVGPVAAVQIGIRQYAQFAGRSSRSEFWWWALFQTVCMIVALILDFLIMSMTGLHFSVFMILVTLAFILPSIAVTIRRLHDVDRSGWYYFITLVPLVGPILFLIACCTRGTAGPNRFGSSPSGLVGAQPAYGY